MPGKTEATIAADPNFIRKVQNAAKAGIRDCFKDVILPLARERSPHETDENADSIGIRIKSGPGRVSASISTSSGYGGYLERGTRKMGPRPYIYPSVQEGLAQLPEMVAARLLEFAAENNVDIPDVVIAGIAGKVKSSSDKGVGIIGGAAARKKRAARLRQHG